MYAEYLKEKTSDHIIETARGFATYRFVDKAVYIVDIYTIPQYRKTNEASTIADIIVEVAKKKGCVELLGSVVPSNKGSTDSLNVLLAYGMKLKSSSDNFIVFHKEI